MILDCSKLEALLLANWTKFIQYRNLLKTLNELANEHLKGHWSVQKATFTRFEYTGGKFTVWVEYEVVRGPETVNLTSEFNLTNTNLFHVRTV